MNIDRMRDARPYFLRGAVFGLIALVALVWRSGYEDDVFTGEFTTEDGFQLLAAFVFLVSGVIAVRGAAKGARMALRSHEDDPRGAPVSFIVSVIGYLVVVYSVVKLLGGDLGGLLLGGALTGVVVGIAAQQTLGNFFAGIVLLLVRPFAVGEYVVLKGATLGGEYEGVVVEMSMFYVHLSTERGAVALPNAGVLAAAVGPGARSADEDDDNDADKEDKEPPSSPAHGGPATSSPTPAG
ncbi:MAG: mechanosensitive ion channel family protein [Actinomycetota bacterium]|nr:mechanosensitive ion channel family protein [Actinomycetota bacterium]